MPSALETAGIRSLNEGDKVTFVLEDDRKGRGKQAGSNRTGLNSRPIKRCCAGAAAPSAAPSWAVGDQVQAEVGPALKGKLWRSLAKRKDAAYTVATGVGVAVTRQRVSPEGSAHDCRIYPCFAPMEDQPASRNPKCSTPTLPSSAA